MIKKQILLILLIILMSLIYISQSNAFHNLSIYYSFEDRNLKNISGFNDALINISQEVAFEGKSSLKILNRKSIWDGLSIDLTYNIENNRNYQVKMMVCQNSNKPKLIQLLLYYKDLSGEKIQIISERIIMPKIWKELSGEFKINYVGYLENFKLIIISPTGIDYDYYVDSIKILGEKNFEIPGIIIRSTFESQTQENWNPRGSEVKLIPTNEVFYESNYSLKVSGRNKTWHGAQIDIKQFFKPNKYYEISLKIFHKEKTTQFFTLSLQRRYKNEKDSKFENLIYQKPVPPNTWIEIRKPYNVYYYADYEELILYLESPNPNLEFYIDDVRITERIMEDLELEVPALKDIYKDYFKIGFMVSYPKLVVLKEAQIIAKKHLTSLTSGNDFKPENLQPKEGEFTFQIADEYVKFAEENNIGLRGHTLVWHEQTPNWFFVDKDGKPTSKELLLKRLETHIKTVVGRYKGKMYAWDVVNEAIDPNQPDGYRRNKWFEIIGPEYIEKAFIWAHEADPNAKLFYNDYDTENPRKRHLIFNLVKNLKEKGIPIHGIGIQGHINIERPLVSDMEETIKLFSSIPGIEIHITELDISVYTKPNIEYERPERNLMLLQAYRYKEIF
ncbi:MAG: endo-1,4-beta-xylanase, partial [Dictyoglomaceae bacterium]